MSSLSKVDEQILSVLKKKPQTFSEILSATGISRPTLSEHLKHLQTLKLVERIPEGRLYCVTQKGDKSLVKLEVVKDVKGGGVSVTKEIPFRFEEATSEVVKTGPWYPAVSAVMRILGPRKKFEVTAFLNVNKENKKFLTQLKAEMSDLADYVANVINTRLAEFKESPPSLELDYAPYNMEKLVKYTNTFHNNRFTFLVFYDGQGWASRSALNQALKEAREHDQKLKAYFKRLTPQQRMEFLEFFVGVILNQLDGEGWPLFESEEKAVQTIITHSKNVLKSKFEEILKVETGEIENILQRFMEKRILTFRKTETPEIEDIRVFTRKTLEEGPQPVPFKTKVKPKLDFKRLMASIKPIEH